MTDLQIELLAKFFSKQRNENDRDLKALFELDDEWKKVYEENRVKLSFNEAGILANKAVIEKTTKTQL